MLVALVVGDGMITHFLVKGGAGREGNPLMASIVSGGDFLLIKTLGALLCALILWDIYRQRPKMALISSLCLVISYAGIIVWNVSVFFSNGF